MKLRLGGAPETAGLPIAFDTESAWHGFRDGRDLLLEARPDRRLWLARVPPDVREVTIHCGSHLVEREKEPVTIRSPLTYPLDQLLMMHLLPLHRGLLVHAAGVRRASGAVVLPGRSGAGKSSLMRLLGGHETLEGLSDDRMVLREIGSRVLAYGTPWPGTEKVATNASAELRAIAFLHQAPQTRLRRIEAREALRQLLPTASIPWFDVDRVAASLAFCDDLLTRVPLYELHFRLHTDVAHALSDLL